MDLLWSVIFASALALGLSGCLGPEGSRVTSGQKFSPEALAFLNDPRTTREQVLAELGEPQVEFPLMRTLEPIASEPIARLVTYLCVAVFTAGFAGWAAGSHPERPRRKAPGEG